MSTAEPLNDHQTGMPSSVEWMKPNPLVELRGSVDLIVANPPYVADGDELPAEVREW